MKRVATDAREAAFPKGQQLQPQNQLHLLKEQNKYRRRRRALLSACPTLLKVTFPHDQESGGVKRFHIIIFLIFLVREKRPFNESAYECLRFCKMYPIYPAMQELHDPTFSSFFSLEMRKLKRNDDRLILAFKFESKHTGENASFRSRFCFQSNLKYIHKIL